MLFRFLCCTLAIIAALAPMTPLARAELPRTLIQQGERFLAMGKYPAAVARYSKVLACCPGSIEAAEAHNDMGVIHARQGNIELAVKEYERALQEPAFPLAHFNLGKALSEQYRENNDDTLRLKALAHLQTFQVYLHEATTLPPVVTYQRAELDAYLQSALEFLSRP